MAMDRTDYLGSASELRPEALRWAWQSYFVTLGDNVPLRSFPDNRWSEST